MAKASTISRPLFHWLNTKTLLGALFLAELLAWVLLRAEAWRQLGMGWQFCLLVLVVATTATLVVIGGACFVRRRAQFGLRTFLLLVLLMGTGLGLIGIKLQSTEKQRRAAAALEQIGAGLSYAGEEQPGLLTFLGRKHFQEPIGLGFHGTPHESDLSNLEALTGLEFLSFGGGVSDDDLAHLAPLRRLCTLNLIGSRVTGHGLQHL
ncbi:MAG TPA: hypothetical protein VG826_33970 [Pirellulales bacterium]|nr:hypothetical protein [Pirellulales bacterium]